MLFSQKGVSGKDGLGRGRAGGEKVVEGGRRLVDLVEDVDLGDGGDAQVSPKSLANHDVGLAPEANGEIELVL